MAQHHQHGIPMSIGYVEISVTDMATAREFYGAASGGSW
ncbi:VOC family protein [Agromyces albus]